METYGDSGERAMENAPHIRAPSILGEGPFFAGTGSRCDYALQADPDNPPGGTVELRFTPKERRRIAKQAGISRRRWKRIMNGTRRPTVEECRRISQLLGLGDVGLRVHDFSGNDS